MPHKDIQPERRLISDDAREFAREERLKKAKHQRHSEKHARFMRHPKHSGAQYDELPSDPNILIGSPEFRRLSVLERIRLVREQYGGTGKSYREPPESEPKQEKSTAEFIEEIRNMKPWMQPSFPQYSVSSPPMPLEPESLTLPYPESELSSDPYIRQFQEAENQKWRIRNGMK